MRSSWIIRAATLLTVLAFHSAYAQSPSDTAAISAVRAFLDANQSNREFWCSSLTRMSIAGMSVAQRGQYNQQQRSTAFRVKIDGRCQAQGVFESASNDFSGIGSFQVRRNDFGEWYATSLGLPSITRTGVSPHPFLGGTPSAQTRPQGTPSPDQFFRAPLPRQKATNGMKGTVTAFKVISSEYDPGIRSTRVTLEVEYQFDGPGEKGPILDAWVTRNGKVLSLVCGGTGQPLFKNRGKAEVLLFFKPDGATLTFDTDSLAFGYWEWTDNDTDGPNELRPVATFKQHFRWRPGLSVQ